MGPRPPCSRAGIRPGKKRPVFSLPDDVPTALDVKGLLSGVIYLYANKMSIPRGKVKKSPAVFSAPEGTGSAFTVLWAGLIFRGSLWE